ncbi:unnamed protein product, partial [Owenia fusiformis]
LEEADEDRKNAYDSMEKRRAENYGLKMELEREKSRYRDDQAMWTTENDELSNKVEDLKSDIKLNEEALAHASMQYNVQLSAVKTENSVLASNLEKEKAAREKFETESTSLMTRFNQASTELDRAQQARNEL